MKKKIQHQITEMHVALTVIYVLKKRADGQTNFIYEADLENENFQKKICTIDILPFTSAKRNKDEQYWKTEP